MSTTTNGPLPYAYSTGNTFAAFTKCNGNKRTPSPKHTPRFKDLLRLSCAPGEFGRTRPRTETIPALSNDDWDEPVR